MSGSGKTVTSIIKFACRFASQGSFPISCYYSSHPIAFFQFCDILKLVKTNTSDETRPQHYVMYLFFKPDKKQIQNDATIQDVKCTFERNPHSKQPYFILYSITTKACDTACSYYHGKEQIKKTIFHRPRSVAWALIPFKHSASEG